MKEHFNRVGELNTADLATLSERGMKLFEEAGELAKEVNKTTGRKISDIDIAAIRDGVLDEAADTIQCVFSVIDEFNVMTAHTTPDITYDELVERIGVKNCKWYDSIQYRKNKK